MTHAHNLVNCPMAMMSHAVIISGRVDAWAPFYEVTINAFKAHGAAIAAVPFFGRGRGNDNAAIDRALAPLRPVLWECVQTWCRANGVPVSQWQ